MGQWVPTGVYATIQTSSGLTFYLQSGTYYDTFGNVVTPPLGSVPPSGMLGVSPSFFKSGIPIISCSTGSMANNGALTAITALPTTYSGGAWVNLPAGAIAAGVPAAQTSYWAVFTTSQAATIYNNIQPATGFPTPPTTLTPFVTTGPGVFAGITAATVLLTVPLPGGSMGANGELRVTLAGNYTNSSGTKAFTVKLGATAYLSNTPTTTTNMYSNLLISNSNAQTINKGFWADINVGSTSTIYGAIDTSTAQNITFNITDNTATDNFVLDSVLIELIPG